MALKYPHECAEPWLMLDIKTEREWKIDGTVRTWDETGLRERTWWSSSKGWLHLLKQHNDIYKETVRLSSGPCRLASSAACSIYCFYFVRKVILCLNMSNSTASDSLWYPHKTVHERDENSAVRAFLLQCSTVYGNYFMHVSIGRIASPKQNDATTAGIVYSCWC